MNEQTALLSPVSTGGSEWSGITRYQSENSYSPPSIIPNGRNNLITPPVSTSSNGLNNGSLPNGMSRRPSDNPGNPSPPNSVARSSNGTTMSDGQRRKQSMMEETLFQHYSTLRRYLAQTLRDEKGNAKPNKARDKLLRLSAVQFQELSTDVYDELLRRQTAAGQQMNASGGVPTYLLPKDNFHPKRNQARQKLSTLPPSRFRDLATDVFYELERRVPRFAGGDMDRSGSPASSIRGPPSRQGTPNGFRPGSRGQSIPRGGPGFGPRQGSLGGQVFAGLGIPGIGNLDDAYGKPTAKTFQSNTIIPNKSTLVEDDDDQTGPEDNYDVYRLGRAGNRRETNNRSGSSGSMERERKIIVDYQTQVGALEEKITTLENQVREKDTALDKLDSSQQLNERADAAERTERDNVQIDLESKLANALNLNKNLQSELDRVRSRHAEQERDLLSQLDRMSRKGDGGSEWQTRYISLETDHQGLQRELREQQRVTDEVRQEASVFLNEMKAISDRSGQNWEREEKLVQQVHRLEDEVKEWKSRYARTKTQLRSLRASSMGLAIQQPNAGQYARDGGFTQQDGLVKDVYVTKFQIAIDEVLRVARVGEPQTVVDYMKSVVVAVRNICQDIGETASSNDEIAQRRAKLRSRVSATANNFITASKNFAVSNGLSPVSLLDAAASHLAAAVVELIRTVKIRPTPAGELEDDDDGNLPAASPGYFTVQNGRTSVAGTSIADSVYSPLSPFTSPQRPGNPHKNSWGSKRPASRNGMPNGTVPVTAIKSGFGKGPQDRDVEELKMFLEDQTEGLVQSIGLLVELNRKNGDAQSVMESIEVIAALVGKVVHETTQSIHVIGNAKLRDEAETIVEKLAACEARLRTAKKEGENIMNASGSNKSTWKDFIDTLPPIAFEIARETRKLVQRVDEVENEGNEDDFR